VWWLVSPQNPLKGPRGMAGLARRMANAAKIARDPRVSVLDLEARLGTRFTVDTLRLLRRRFPRVRFVWLMGADLMVELRHWRRWPDIFRRAPVAVFARPAYCHRALAEIAAQRFRRRRVAPGAARRLAAMAPPAWTFLPVRLDPLSATAIRSRTRPRRRKDGKETAIKGGSHRP
jgi:nicotinate-nucleotide adenylyltransferase